jgi:tetratricopeptide (TPR) repeat protein
MNRSHVSIAFKAASAAAVLCAALQGTPARADDRAYLEAGRAMVQRGEMADGLRVVAAAVALNPEDHVARSYLLGTLDGACCGEDVGLHVAVLAVLPHDPGLLDRLASLYERQARYADAAALRMRNMPLAPNDPEYHARMFLYFELVGDMERALRCLARYRALGGHREEILSRAPAAAAEGAGRGG